MKKKYSPEYREIINELLQDEASQFWDAAENEPPTAGLRINPQKTTLSDIKTILPELIHPLPWTPHGMGLQTVQDLGKHPYHAAGLFYLQEPSAMVPVAVLDPQPGERILDLCAAPGGKATQIQSRMENTGLLIANDANPQRVQALSRNLERWGARNTAVTCETPERISKHLAGFFDRVLVDAPCSGEGRFRSDPGEMKSWSPNFSRRCSQTQDELLWFAAKLVKPNGILVYSTCTFNQHENEGAVARFLEKNPDFDIDPIELVEGFSQGIPLESSPAIDFSGVVRIWPHKTLGEGHFAARLRKSNSPASSAWAQPGASRPDLPPEKDHLRIYSHFFDTTLNSTAGTEQIQPGSPGLKSFGNRLYWIPPEMPSLVGLDVRHWGWWLGTVKSNRFIPSSALAFALFPEDAQKVLEFSVDDPNLLTYRRGSPLASSKIGGPPAGWNLVTCEGYTLGWGWVDQERMKSYHPRWLRSV